MSPLRGVIVPVAVPLNERREPDLAAYRRLIDQLLASGVHGIFANGSMGAFALLSDAWQDRLIGAAVDHVAGRVPVLAGIADTSPGRVRERAERLLGVAVDAFVVMPPYYYLASQPELHRFFTLLADSLPKPLVLYDNPRLARNSLSAETIIALSHHPNVTGVKLSGVDVTQWQDLVQAPLDRGNFALISGAGRLTSLALRLGFDGITEGLHNVFPHLAVALWRFTQNGDWAQAERVQQQINRCFRIFDLAGGWRGLEAAFQHMGLSAAAALPPYDLPLPEGAAAEIRQILEAEGVPGLVTATATVPPRR